MPRKSDKSKSPNPSRKSVNTDHESLPKGKLQVARSGTGFVLMTDGRDVLVKPYDMANALHGDVVRVKVVKENKESGRREGKVTEVVERGRVQFVGRVQTKENFGFFVQDNNNIPDFFLPPDALNGAEDGDKVLAELVRWNKDDRKPVGKVLEVYKGAAENDLAMKSLLLEKGFPLSFPDEVMAEADAISDEITDEDYDTRKDFRQVFTITIDPADAKDFDDAISFRQVKEDVYELGIHIADVSHFVKPGTQLDEEAYRRATSVYLPDRVNPMLPEHISNVLCSLRPHENKFTFSAVFHISSAGEVKDYWLGRTLIHSNHRFTYEEAQDIIEGKSEGPHKEEILTMNRIARKLREGRFAKGAINFSSQEVRFQLDENAKPIGIMIKESKEAHQLIEEFMLLANQYVAMHVGKIEVNHKPVPFPYRIHDAPDPEKLEPFVAFAKTYGITFRTDNPQAISESFNQMLKTVEGRPEQPVLETLGIRTMAKAIYSQDNIGHYGLAFTDYTHFTSPIRRYPDILVHRILQSVLDGKPIIDPQMEAKCQHCSERERAAMEAERAANKYKQVEYMQQFVGDIFEAVISGVSTFGFWAETIDHKCEGLVSMTTLGEWDEFLHVEASYQLVGRRSGRTFNMGDKVLIKVVNANLDRRQLDYEWLPNVEAGDHAVKMKGQGRRMEIDGGRKKGSGGKKGGSRGGRKAKPAK